MKKILLLITTAIALGLAPTFAQPGPSGDGQQGPHFDGAVSELFGTNQSFSAMMEYQTFGRNGGYITMSGKFSFDNGKSRFEMNTSEMQGSPILPGATARMKSMGMDRMISITRPDLKLAYIVYPDLNSYAVMTQQYSSASSAAANFKIETTELGKETVDGHECVKNKVVVIDKEGNKHESTGWNATDLKKFPVKIAMNEDGRSVRMLFKDISFGKPAASNFEPPTGLTKYDDVQTMIRTEMMKKRGGGLSAPPQQN